MDGRPLAGTAQALKKVQGGPSAKTRIVTAPPFPNKASECRKNFWLLILIFYFCHSLALISGNVTMKFFADESQQTNTTAYCFPVLLT